MDDDFKQLHPEIPVVKKSDSPDEDKSIGDSTSLKPVLSDFFALHPHFQPNPTCPKDPSLDMKYLGHCHEKGRADRDKWGCPKVHMVKGQWVCDCTEPCSTAKKGRTTYTYENMDFRIFPGIQRDTDEWKSLYKIRTIVERAINHFKINMCVAERRTRNHITTKADVFLAGIASQLTVIVAYRMNCPQYIRSLKPLAA